MSDRIPADFELRVRMGQSDPEIADYAGVSSRTVRRWRHRLGLPSCWTPPVPEHGTPGRYAQGCTCNACRADNAARWQRWTATTRRSVMHA